MQIKKVVQIRKIKFWFYKANGYRHFIVSLKVWQAIKSAISLQIVQIYPFFFIKINNLQQETR